MSNWRENKWQDKAGLVVSDTAQALETVYAALNQGQRQKVLKDEKVKALFDHYGVNCDESGADAGA